MKVRTILLIFLSSMNLFAQHNLESYINSAYRNNPAIKEQKAQLNINNLQRELDYAQNSGFQMYMSANYLFVPYFNNKGGILSTNPDVNAIGYDIGITNGGLYSAQFNIEKNIFNGALLNALERQRMISAITAENNIELLKRDLRKQVTDQYLQTYSSFQLYKMSNELITYLTNQLKILGELVESGMAKQSDYLLLSVELENQKISINDYYSQFLSNLFELNSLCGIKDSSVVELEPVSLMLQSKKLSSAVLKKFELDSLAVENQQRVFETRYQPQVSLFFNTGLNAVELTNIQRKFGLSAGINFSLPIYDGNQRSITRQQVRVSIETINNYKSNFAILLDNQKSSALKKIESLKNNLENLSKQIESYNTIIKISEQELRQGQLSMIEYLTILKNFTDLKKNKIVAEINYQLEINNYNYWNY
ncbi:TolC family protein [Melioribacteraceae bacterium 4301-Me]|uniref:TolC family protein n=1 Tax=Pyranulibacter aquaticus TaxID=3163344 RepID=UPI003595570C